MYTIGSDTNAPVLAATLVVAVGALQTLQMVVPRYYWDGLASTPEYAYADGYGGHIEAVSVGATQVTITANSCAGADTMTYSRLSPVSAAANVSSWLTALCSAVDADADIDGDATILGSQPLTANLATGTAWDIIVSMAANYGLDVIHVATDEDGDTVLFRHPTASTASLSAILAYQRVETKPQYDYCVVTKLAQITQQETIDYDPNNGLGGVQYTSENQPYLTGSWTPLETEYTPQRLLAADNPGNVLLKSTALYMWKLGGDGYVNKTWLTMAPVWGKVYIYSSDVNITNISAPGDFGQPEPDPFANSSDKSKRSSSGKVFHDHHTESVGDSWTTFGVMPGVREGESYALRTVNGVDDVLDGWNRDFPAHACALADEASHDVGAPGYSIDDVITNAHGSGWVEYYEAVPQYNNNNSVIGWSKGRLTVQSTSASVRTTTLTAWSNTTPMDYPWAFAIRRIDELRGTSLGNIDTYAGEQRPDGSWGFPLNSSIRPYQIRPSEALFSSNFDFTSRPATIDPSPPADIDVAQDDEAFFDPSAEIEWKWQLTSLYAATITYQLSQASTTIKLQPSVSNAMVTLLNRRTGAVESYRTTDDIEISPALHADPLSVTVLGSNDDSWSTTTGTETGEGCTLTGTVWSSKSIGQAVAPLALWKQARAVMVSILVPVQAIAPIVNLVGSTRIILAEQVYITRVSIDLGTAQAEISGYVRSA